VKNKFKTIRSIKGGLFCILLLSLLFLNVSCFNSLQEEPPVIYIPPVTTTATITGKISILDEASRSIFPSLPSGAGYTYYAQVTPAGGSPLSGSIPDTHDYYTISNLSIGVIYTVEVGIKDSSNNTVLVDTYIMPEALTAENPVYTRNVVLKPVQTTNGKGTISLTIEIPSDSGITKYKTSNVDGVFTVSGTSINITENNVTAGSKSIDFYFYDDDMHLLYYFTDTVNVYNFMTSGEWVRNGGNGSSPHLVDVTETVGGVTTTVTKCRITKALVDSFKMRTFYVKDGGNDSNSGTFFDPLETITGALAKMRDSSVDYTIFVIGTLSGPHYIDENVYTINANSITVCGYNGLDYNGIPQDTLYGDNMTSALRVETDHTIILKNIKITHGDNSAHEGGGIALAEGTVKLTNGVLIERNIAKDGGGVYVETGAKLFIYGSALIGDEDNSDSLSGYGEANTAQYGGGIYNKGSVYLGYSDYTSSTNYTLASIPQGYGIRRNYVQNSENPNPKGGGGIYNMGTVIMASGDIAYNSASGAGGGIYNCGSATFQMNNGLFKGNRTSAGGGAIENAANGTVILEAGTIESNEANLGAGAFGNQGTFKIKGAVRVPYGGSQKQNDITPYSPITLSDNFSTHSSSEKIAITYLANTYFVRGKKLFDADTGVSITSTVLSNFQITEADWNLVPYNSNSEGRLDAEVWVAGSSERDSSVGSPSGSNTGTKSKPVNSIATAITRIENSEWPSAKNWTIKINGTVTGAQTIEGSLSKISTLTLDSFGSTHTLDGAFTGSGSSKGCTLSITAGIDVNIYSITITGGKNTNTNAKGGGIYINNGTKSVYIDGATITENTAYQGGGIYVEAGDLHLIDATISSNTASNAGGAVFAAVDITHGGAIEIPNSGASKNNDIYLSGTSKIINDYSFSSEVGISLPDNRYALYETIINRDESLSADIFESDLLLYQLLGTKASLFSLVKSGDNYGKLTVQSVSAITGYVSSWHTYGTVKSPGAANGWPDNTPLHVLLKKDDNNYAIVKVIWTSSAEEQELDFEFVKFTNGTRAPDYDHTYFNLTDAEDLYGTNIFTVSSDQPDIGAYLLMNDWDLYTSYSWCLVE